MLENFVARNVWFFCIIVLFSFFPTVMTVLRKNGTALSQSELRNVFMYIIKYVMHVVIVQSFFR
jgi:hypothetical protein